MKVDKENSLPDTLHAIVIVPSLLKCLCHRKLVRSFSRFFMVAATEEWSCDHILADFSRTQIAATRDLDLWQQTAMQQTA